MNRMRGLTGRLRVLSLDNPYCHKCKDIPGCSIKLETLLNTSNQTWHQRVPGWSLNKQTAHSGDPTSRSGVSNWQVVYTGWTVHTVIHARWQCGLLLRVTIKLGILFSSRDHGDMRRLIIREDCTWWSSSHDQEENSFRHCGVYLLKLEESAKSGAALHIN